jgi:WD40 repeat protein
LIGRRVKCPGCGAALAVNAEAEAEPASPQPPRKPEVPAKTSQKEVAARARPEPKDEEDEPRPTKKKKKPREAVKRSLLLPLILGGAGVAIATGVVVMLMLPGRTPEKTSLARPTGIPSLPSGTDSLRNVRDVKYSPDGKRLAFIVKEATGVQVHSVVIWDIAANAEVTRLPLFSGPISAFDISPDGRILAVGLASGQSVTLWNMATGAEVHRVNSDDKVRPGLGSFFLGFTPDKKSVACLGPGYLGLVDLQTGKLATACKVQMHDTWTCAAISPTEPLVVIGTIQTNAAGTEVTRELVFADYATGSTSVVPCEGTVSGIAFSRDGKSMHVIFTEGRIAVYDPHTREVLGQSDGPYKFPRYPPVVTPDGRALVAGCWVNEKGQVALWRRGDVRPLLLPDSACEGFSLSPDGKTVAVATPGGTVRFLQLDAARAVSPPPPTTQVPERPPLISVTAEELCKTYLTDKAAANAKYKGKLLEVEGAVNRVQVMHKGQVVLNLRGVPGKGDKGEFVVTPWDVDSNTPGVRELCPGQRIKYRGVCSFVDLGERGGNVVIERGEMVEIGPDPSRRFTVEQFIKEFPEVSEYLLTEKDMAVKAKYEAMSFILEGTVESVEPPGKVDIVNLVGTVKKGDSVIGVRLAVEGGYFYDQAAKLKKGDPIKAKCQFVDYSKGKLVMRLLYLVK